MLKGKKEEIKNYRLVFKIYISTFSDYLCNTVERLHKKSLYFFSRIDHLNNEIKKSNYVHKFTKEKKSYVASD